MPEVRLLVVGTETYDHWDWIDTAASMQKVHDTFAKFNASTDRAVDDNGEALKVKAEHARSALDRWFAGPDAATSAAINTVLYLVGHGDVDDNALMLVTYDTPTNALVGSAALKIEEVGGALRDRIRSGDEANRGWTIVIIDCCKAGLGLDQIAGMLTGLVHDRNRNVALIGASDNGTSFNGELPDALDRVVASLGPQDTDISVKELLTRTATEIGGTANARVDELAADALLSNPNGAFGALSGQVDSMAALDAVIADLSTTRPDVVAHFLHKAQGTEIDERAWFFEGRDIDTRQLVRWLAQTPHGMYVLTGDAGSGKSAMLGRLVTFSEPELLAGLLNASILTEAPAEALIADRPFDAVIHLTSMTFANTVQRVSEIAGVDPSGPEGVSDIDALLAHLAVRTEPFTLLVDALDESLDPFPIAASLLRRLAAIDGVQVVVGTRRSLNEGPDIARADDTHLITALGLRLDTENRAGYQVSELKPDPEAIQRYAKRRLTHPQPGRGTLFTDNDAEGIADQIAARDQPFLFARLATTELLAQPDLTSQQIETLLAGGHADIFSQALDRFAAADHHTVPLLRALAYGLGRGFPQRFGLWATITEALHPGIEIREDDIKQTLATAGAYIVRDGQRIPNNRSYTTFRLAHRTFAEHFNNEDNNAPPN